MDKVNICLCGAFAGYLHNEGCPYPCFRNDVKSGIKWQAKKIKLSNAVCVGCGKKVSKLKEYGKYNPVQEDGTYKNYKFVCTKCYVKLIPLGLDVGTPEEIQERMIKIKENNKK